MHVDADHHRSVLTIIGEPQALVDSVIDLAQRAVDRLDLRVHEGVHPRLGVVDVVPFVPLGSASMEDAVLLRDEAARRLATTCDLPSFLYGPLGGATRSLPEVRRKAPRYEIVPDFGPLIPGPVRGAAAVGARPIMVAWNLWLSGATLNRAQEIAAAIRGPHLRAMGFEVSGAVQVSCNLLAPLEVTCADVADQVAGLLAPGETILRAELVGLAPQAMLAKIDPGRFDELDLSEDRTIEAAATTLGLVIA